MSDDLISIADVEHVAKLARIAVSEVEKKRYQGQLAKILGHVSQLTQKNTDGVPPTAHPFDVSNVWREDKAEPFDNIPALLKNAPETEETFFRVKKVIE
jgi:aspartyl-tRNA(Asn)/glutamyl-tRNA(Gln) amidotransferase subunit C